MYLTFIPFLFLKMVLNYSRFPVTRTLYNSNLPRTRGNFHFLSDSFLHNFTLDNSNCFLFPFKVRVIGIRLYLLKEVLYVSLNEKPNLN